MLFRSEIKIVHVHGASYASFWRKRIFIRLAKRFGKKVVFHCHGAEFKRFTAKHPAEVAAVMKKCDCIIALSQSWKEWFETTFQHPNVTIVKNVISNPHIDKVPHERFSLLFLGRLGQRKGIYDLLDVMADHREEWKGKLELLFGGDGEVEKVGTIIRERGLEDMAHYQGWVDGAKKTALLNRADAYILPSYNEGLPISILEAMSYGMPIISTRVGGIPEILTNEVNGFIMEPGDKETLYQSVNYLRTHPKETEVMGEESKRRVVEHLPSYVASQLEAIYNQLL
jgi:glycosyltransferase involved in cell wall biosynthesis